MTPPLRFVVLGDPVEHSLSPRMHNAALQGLGLAGEYGRRRVDRGGMTDAATEIRSGALDGANITMPFKGVAAELADTLADEAARARSVNTWVPDHGTIRGYSTDVVGVRRVLEEGRMPGGRVVVLGTGGAASAALIALEGRPITVMARRPEAARDMVAHCGVEAEIRPWSGDVPPGLVINCTPIGMNGEELPPRMLEEASAFFEMVYASGETPAQRAAAARGIPVVDGLSLLAAQAEASFELWTGEASPPGVMYRSVDKYLKGDAGKVES